MQAMPFFMKGEHKMQKIAIGIGVLIAVALLGSCFLLIGTAFESITPFVILNVLDLNADSYSLSLWASSFLGLLWVIVSVIIITIIYMIGGLTLRLFNYRCR